VLLVDDAGLDPAWIEATLIPVLTDPGRIAAMSARASAAGAPDADIVLAGMSSARSPHDAGSPPENYVIGRRTVARRVVPP
jgi:hypothetical protein